MSSMLRNKTSWSLSSIAGKQTLVELIFFVTHILTEIISLYSLVCFW